MNAKSQGQILKFWENVDRAAQPRYLHSGFSGLSAASPSSQLFHYTVSIGIVKGCALIIWGIFLLP
jgi:hypothetical protein